MDDSTSDNTSFLDIENIDDSFTSSAPLATSSRLGLDTLNSNPGIPETPPAQNNANNNVNLMLPPPVPYAPSPVQAVIADDLSSISFVSNATRLKKVQNTEPNVQTPVPEIRSSTSDDETVYGLDDLTCSMMCDHDHNKTDAEKHIEILEISIAEREEFIETLKSECNVVEQEKLNSDEDIVRLSAHIEHMQNQMNQMTANFVRPDLVDKSSQADEVNPEATHLEGTRYFQPPTTSLESDLVNLHLQDEIPVRETKTQECQAGIETTSVAVSAEFLTETVDQNCQTDKEPCEEKVSIGVIADLPQPPSLTFMQKCADMQAYAQDLRKDLSSLKSMISVSQVSQGPQITSIIERFFSRQQQEIFTLKQQYSRDLDVQNEKYLELQINFESAKITYENYLKEKNEDIRSLKTKVGQLEDLKSNYERKLSSLSARLSPEGSELDTDVSVADTNSLQSHMKFTRTKMEHLHLVPPVTCIDDGEVLEENCSSEHGNSVEEDLRLQITDLEKKLDYNKRYLEDQTAERELERDDFHKNVVELQSRAEEWKKEKDRLNEVISHQKLELDDYEVRLKETIETEQELVNRTEKLEDELKNSVEKIFELRDIIRDLEEQIEIATTNVSELKEHNHMLSESLQHRDLEKGDNVDLMNTSQETVTTLCSAEYAEEIHSQLRDLTQRMAKRVVEVDHCPWPTTRPNSSCSGGVSASTEDISVRELTYLDRPDAEKNFAIGGLFLSDGLRRLDTYFDNLIRFEEVICKKLKEVEMKCENYQKRVQELESDKQIHLENSRIHINKISDLESRLDQYRFEPAPSVVTLSGLKSRLTNLSEEVEEYKGKLALKNIEYDELSNRYAEKQALLENYKKSAAAVRPKRNFSVQVQTETRKIGKEASVQTSQEGNQFQNLELSSIPGGPPPTHSTPNDAEFIRRKHRNEQDSDTSWTNHLQNQTPELLRDRQLNEGSVAFSSNRSHHVFKDNSLQEHMAEHHKMHVPKQAPKKLAPTETDYVEVCDSSEEELEVEKVEEIPESSGPELNVTVSRTNSVGSGRSQQVFEQSESVETRSRQRMLLTETQIELGVVRSQMNQIAKSLQAEQEQTVELMEALEKEKTISEHLVKDLHNEIDARKKLTEELQNQKITTEELTKELQQTKGAKDQLVKHFQSSKEEYNRKLLLKATEYDDLSNRFAANEALLKNYEKVAALPKTTSSAQTEEIEARKEVAVQTTNDDQTSARSSNVPASQIHSQTPGDQPQGMASTELIRTTTIQSRMGVPEGREGLHAGAPTVDDIQSDSLFSQQRSQHREVRQPSGPVSAAASGEGGIGTGRALFPFELDEEEARSQQRLQDTETQIALATVRSQMSMLSRGLSSEQALTRQLRNALENEKENSDRLASERDSLLGRIEELQDSLTAVLQERSAARATEFGEMKDVPFKEHLAIEVQCKCDGFLKVRSHRKALAWQKKYLTCVILGYKALIQSFGMENLHPDFVQRTLSIPPGCVGLTDKKTGKKRFRIYALYLIAVYRLKFMCRRWENRAIHFESTRSISTTRSQLAISPPTRENLRRSASSATVLYNGLNNVGRYPSSTARHHPNPSNVKYPYTSNSTAPLSLDSHPLTGYIDRFQQIEDNLIQGIASSSARHPSSSVRRRDH